MYIIRSEFILFTLIVTFQEIADYPVGIHLVHGANNTFGNDRIFELIFTAYNKKLNYISTIVRKFCVLFLDCILIYYEYWKCCL